MGISRVRVLSVLGRSEIECCFLSVLLLRFENDSLFLSMILPPKTQSTTRSALILILDSLVLGFCTGSSSRCKHDHGDYIF